MYIPIADSLLGDVEAASNTTKVDTVHLSTSVAWLSHPEQIPNLKVVRLGGKSTSLKV